MFVITLADHAHNTIHAHPYMPASTAEARAVAQELSRDFPGSVVAARPLSGGSPLCVYRDGGLSR